MSRIFQATSEVLGLLMKCITDFIKSLILKNVIHYDGLVYRIYFLISILKFSNTCSNMFYMYKEFINMLCMFI